MYHAAVRATSVRGLALALVLLLASCTEPTWARQSWPSSKVGQLAQPVAFADELGLELSARTITWEPDAITIELALVHRGACELSIAPDALLLEYDGLEYASALAADPFVLAPGDEATLALRYELGRPLRGPGARLRVRGLACDARTIDEPPELGIPPMPAEP